MYGYVSNSLLLFNSLNFFSLLRNIDNLNKNCIFSVISIFSVLVEFR